MASSKKNLTLLTVAGGIFAAVMLAGVAGNVIRGNYMAIPIVIVVLLLAIGIISVGIWLNQRRIQLMYRKPTPDQLIEHYHAALAQAKVRKVPHADAVSAYLSAVAATVYGQYDRAREELATVDWDEAPPVHQGQRLDVLALIALMERADDAQARQLATEAGTLGNASPDSASVLHNAVLVAVGEGDAGLIKRTQRAAERGAGAMAAVSAWALLLYCERNDQTTEAEHYRKSAQEAAPHFVGLKHSGTA